VSAPLRCDALVIGGGPAGTATALALQARGIQALVVERSRYEGPHPGETLLGEAKLALVSLGVWDRFRSGHSAAAAPVLSCWGDAQPRARPPELNPHGVGWHVDRSWLDAMLARAAEDAGALVYCGVRPHRVERTGSVWRVVLRGAGTGQAEMSARYLVDATGRAAWLARRLGSDSRRVDGLVGLVANYARALPDPSLLVEAASEGWWYSVPRPDGGAAAVYLTDVDFLSRHRRQTHFDACLQKTTHTRQRLRLLGAPTLRVVAAQTIEQTRCAGEGWLAVGDATFALDPLSGSGVCRALESGIRAAETITASLRGRPGAETAYHEQSRQQFAQQLRARTHFYGLERRWATSAFWQRRSYATIVRI
jgi:flavin-dependent dehydrogenase